ncbi:NF041680 family putative transposase [Kitasatospora cineracea]|uniref:DDE superfamily endonuclease n=1 Tax=Kitasatospora cineracea TaxID=88074 RepID=A0A3N4RMK6_9ACTN|nr:NF041680 family putative transposase [Kitasatospora cineracea]RPE34046.1 DDE superfamily endonuclease [Kitasatospora cineracea]RPE35511.1 DDE superfamily endonuclease [Kitasatospora cineracea]
MSVLHKGVCPDGFAELSRFRGEFYACLTRRGDAMFELADAVLCADGPVRSLVELSLVGEHRRGHGGLYDALARGRLDADRMRQALAAVPLPRAADGRLVLAVDITCWLRPDAHTSPQRILCHTYGRGKDQHIPVPGWPYSVVTALEPGRSSWTAPLDALRLAPGDDAATVTAQQLRELVHRLITAGQWQPGDPEMLVVADAGYDAPRLAFLLKDLPVQVLARMRSDRVLRRTCPPRIPGTRGRPPRHGGEFVFGDPATWNTPDTETVTDTRLYGTARARSWDRLHPRLTHRSSWAAQDGALPVIEGTVIRLEVAHLPSGATPKPVWLWWSETHAAPADTDRLWQAFLRRFDIEHTFRLFKQTLGWTRPKIRTPEAADRWTWLILAAYTQLRLARPLAADLRRPWEQPAPPERLTPARVRRGFRNLRPKTTCPAGAPKPSRPGPGRPPGRKNTHPTPRHDVHTTGKTGPAKPSVKKKPEASSPRPRRTG